jgi:hypothetical protein
MKIDSRDHQLNNAGENQDRLLLIVPPYPIKLGIVAAPEELGVALPRAMSSGSESLIREETAGKG